jgi:RNA polymerase sigma-70 factor, ECF subfamily
MATARRSGGTAPTRKIWNSDGVVAVSAAGLWLATTDRGVRWWVPGTVVSPERGEVSDEALCAGVAARDEAAFDRLVERYQARAYRLAWSLLRNAEDARDVSQEAFLRVYQSADRFRGDARFATWFYRILVNLCLDHRRHRRWWHRLVARDADDDLALVERQPALEPDPGERASEQQTMTRLWDAVHRLSPQQRATVVLAVQEHLATAEIASVLECSEATVRVHLHRAVQSLRKMLKP